MLCWHRQEWIITAKRPKLNWTFPLKKKKHTKGMQKRSFHMFFSRMKQNRFIQPCRVDDGRSSSVNPAGSDQCPKHGAETEARRADRWTRRQTSCLAPQIDITIKSGLVIFIRLTPRPRTSYTRKETNYGCSWVWPGALVQGNMRREGWDRGHKSYLHLICEAWGWLTVRQLACAAYR